MAVMNTGLCHSGCRMASEDISWYFVPPRVSNSFYPPNASTCFWRLWASLLMKLTPLKTTHLTEPFLLLSWGGQWAMTYEKAEKWWRGWSGDGRWDLNTALTFWPWKVIKLSWNSFAKPPQEFKVSKLPSHASGPVICASVFLFLWLTLEIVLSDSL